MIFIEYVEFEIKRALEWLGGNDNKKLAAVLILRELAIHTPTLFYMQFQQFFDNIFSAVRDPKVNISSHFLFVLLLIMLLIFMEVFCSCNILLVFCYYFCSF